MAEETTSDKDIQIQYWFDLIKNAEDQLRMLRSPRLEYNPDDDAYVPVRDGDVVLEWTEKDARASADLLRFIGDCYKEIGMLRGLGASKGGRLPDAGEKQSQPLQAIIYVNGPQLPSQDSDKVIEAEPDTYVVRLQDNQ